MIWLTRSRGISLISSLTSIFRRTSSISTMRPRKKSPVLEQIRCVGGEPFCSRGNVSSLSRLILSSSGAPPTISSTLLILSFGTKVTSDWVALSVTPRSSIRLTSQGIESPVRKWRAFGVVGCDFADFRFCFLVSDLLFCRLRRRWRWVAINNTPREASNEGTRISTQIGTPNQRTFCASSDEPSLQHDVFRLQPAVSAVDWLFCLTNNGTFSNPQWDQRADCGQGKSQTLFNAGTNDCDLGVFDTRHSPAEARALAQDYSQAPSPRHFPPGFLSVGVRCKSQQASHEG